ncbi:toll/interleukin-1 receptor domain-containing protein [Cellulosimicrobium cellulans]|uniref:toll/interleukin-1 receptor domain-containing protein n=1 Tax=Cellulosimicrobium cellulans TaxID=1710 RepID=UPI0024075290|nr:toll/interleukin-1 receptor domain-containing protein [Cellulosimicrobium cellulans]MDF9875412.1 hypothetical protein [Cellulosimicrobium cellulans]
MADAKRVFISYVKENSREVDQLCAILDAAQIPYFRDRTALGPGDAWRLKIRQAIKDGALVFLACFSEKSRARDKSYMNEELVLAAEEYRLRVYGRPWLVPVRFDDGEVPLMDLGAGRTLDDINRVDLFGDQYAAQAAALVTTIHRVMGDSTADEATTLASIEAAGSSERPAQLRRLTKEMLPDPSRRIALDDLVTTETSRLVQAMQDEDQFPLSLSVTNGPEAFAEVVDTATRYWALTEPLCATLQVAARWADKTALSPWTSALHRLHSESNRILGGNSALLGLRQLPLLFATFTAGLAATSQDRWDNVKTLLVDVVVPESRRDTLTPLVSAVHPYRPFEGPELVPHVLARVAREGETPAAALEAFEKNKVGKYHTPVAEWLHSVLRPTFSEQLPDEALFDRQFDRTEIVLGLLDQDRANEAANGWRPSAHWFGRSTWRARHGYVTALQEFTSQLAAQQHAWPPLQAGLFGGSVERAQAAVREYTETFGHIGSSSW